MGNKSQFDGAALKLRTLADRRHGEAHPLEVGSRSGAPISRLGTNAYSRCAANCLPSNPTSPATEVAERPSPSKRIHERQGGNRWVSNELS